MVAPELVTVRVCGDVVQLPLDGLTDILPGVSDVVLKSRMYGNAPLDTPQPELLHPTNLILDFLYSPDDVCNWKVPDDPLIDPSFDEIVGTEGSAGVLLSEVLTIV